MGPHLFPEISAMEKFVSFSHHFRPSASQRGEASVGLKGLEVGVDPDGIDLVRDGLSKILVLGQDRSRTRRRQNKNEGEECFKVRLHRAGARGL